MINGQLTPIEIDAWTRGVDRVETILHGYFPGIRLNSDALMAALTDRDESGREKVYHATLVRASEKERGEDRDPAATRAWVQALLPKVFQEGGGSRVSFDLNMMPQDKGTKLDGRQIAAVNDRLLGSKEPFSVPTFFYPAGGSMYIEFNPAYLALAALRFVEFPELFSVGKAA